MKQREIDRWMRHQAHLEAHRTLPSINWVIIITLLMIGIACLYVILKLTHTA